MNVDQINNIDELIHLEDGKKITSHKVQRLTAAGENYGSLMLSVEINVKTPDGTEQIHAVAKLVPPNEFIQEIFNTQVTFRNEIAFYKNIIPTLQNFQRERGINKVIEISAKYYGSRLNLQNDDSKVDSGAALVLENLNLQGYTTLDRIAGLDFDAAALVLKNLAHLHAVPLALRLQKPSVFEKKIKPHLNRWTVTGNARESMREEQLRIIREIPELQSLKDRIMIGFERFHNEPVINPIFKTVVHEDCWTNNNMFKLEDDKPVKSILVDFQIVHCGSLAQDVIFFIFSSLKNEVIKDRYDDLLKLYHETFTSLLKELGCDVSPYSYKAFLKEIDTSARDTQFGHVAFMLLPILAPQGSVQEIADFNIDSFHVKELTEVHKDKYVFVYNEFARRGWI